MEENNIQLMLSQILQNQTALQASHNALHADFNNFARDIGATVATHDTQLHTLCGNGQPGEVSEIKAAIARIWSAIGALQQNWKYALGTSFGGGCVVAVVGWAVEVWVKR